jgi:transcriptional regulator with XRE-family HTH domain
MNEQKILENFGLNFKHYRNKAKMSQDDIVELTGFSKSYISNVERGKHNISLVNAIKFANTVNKTIDEMIVD